MNTKSFKQTRNLLGLKQSELARRLGVTQAYYSMLERGKRPATGKVAEALVRELDLSPTLLPRASNKKVEKVGTDLLVSWLSALKYPFYGHMKAGSPVNPADFVKAVLHAVKLDLRVAEAVPWVLYEYADLDWKELAREAKLANATNRLGFFSTLARELSELKNDRRRARLLRAVENALEPAKLVRTDELSELTPSQKKWLQTRRSDAASRWNVLSDLSLETLRYAK